MTKILVTGSSGLLGSSLVPYLNECGHKVLTQARRSQADYRFDLSDRAVSFEQLNAIRPDCIINLVGLTNVETCEEHAGLAYLGNTRPVENIAQWITNSGGNCHLVHISTDHLYDGVGLNKEGAVEIVNNYAFSKYAGELATTGIPSTILRTNFIGRSKVSNRDSLTDWLFKAVKSGQKIQVLDDVYFSPLSITILSEMIALVVRRKPLGTYNLGSRTGISKSALAFEFLESLGLPAHNVTRIESRDATFLKAPRPNNMRMDVSCFEKQLDIKLPQTSELIPSIAKEYHDSLQSRI